MKSSDDAEQGGTGCRCDMLSENICGLHGVNHQTNQYLEKEKVITDKWTDKQTDRISYLRLHSSVEGVK